MGTSSDVIDTDQGDYVACGIEYDWEYDGRSPDSRFGFSMTTVLCNINNFSDTRLMGDSLSTRKMCPRNRFINGFRIQSMTLQDRLKDETTEHGRNSEYWSFEVENTNLLSQEMLYGLKFECKTLDGRGTQEMKVFELKDKADMWQEWTRLPQMDNDNNTRFGIVSISYEPAALHYVDFINSETPDHNNQNRRYYRDIHQLTLFYKVLPVKGSSLENGARTYSAFWKGKQDIPTAIFATPIFGNSIGRDAFEENRLGFMDAENLSTDILNGIPYGISDSYFSSGVLAMTSFNRVSNA